MFWQGTPLGPRMLTKCCRKTEFWGRLGQAAELITRQGGNPAVIDEPSLLPQAAYQTVIRSERSGYVKCIDALKAGRLVMQLGAGRQTKESSVDLSVGIELCQKVGSYVQQDDVLAVVHSNRPISGEHAAALTVSPCRLRLGTVH